MGADARRRRTKGLVRDGGGATACARERVVRLGRVAERGLADRVHWLRSQLLGSHELRPQCVLAYQCPHGGAAAWVLHGHRGHAARPALPPSAAAQGQHVRAWALPLAAPFLEETGEELL